MKGIDRISSFLLTVLGSLRLPSSISVVLDEDLNLVLHLEEVLVEFGDTHT